MHRTFRGFAAICGATLAVGGAAALSNGAFAQTPAPAPAPAAPAAPASTATPWTYQGLFDLYYLYDANSPRGGETPSSNTTGFEYDEEANSPALALAELNIAKAAPAAGGLGFKATIIGGETAGLNADDYTSAAGTPAYALSESNNEARFENVQQLFVTYALKDGYTFEAGKFYTPFGYEVTESNGNMNYSHSFIFSDLLPVYETGVSVTTPTYKGLYATGYIVRSLFNADLSGNTEGVDDQNKSAAYMGYLNYTAPSGKFVAVESYGGSDDGPNGFTDKVLLSDTDLTITPDAVDTFGLNYTNRKDDYQGDSAVDNGYAAYYKRQLTGTMANYNVAFRAEEITTKESFATGLNEPKVDSLTATLSDQTTKSLLVRLELRHDDAKTNSPAIVVPTAFFGGNPAGVATQNTVSLSAVYTFGP